MKQGKESDRATLQWLGRVSGKNKKYIVLLVIVQTALSLGSISYALIFRGIVDAAMAGSRSNLNRWILLFIALVIFQVSMGACNRFLREYTQALLENCFKNRLFSFFCSNVIMKNIRQTFRGMDEPPDFGYGCCC